MKSEWQSDAFGELVDFISEKGKATDASPLAYISTENMLPNFGGITEASTLPIQGSITRFKEGDILFSNIRTYFRKVWRAEFDGHCSNDVLVFRSKNAKQLLPNYLYHLCRWDRFIEFSVKTSKGAKMPRGDKAALVKFQVPIPTFSEQKAINNILDGLDNKIEINRQMNKTLEAMANCLFKSWFVDFDPVHAKQEGRAPEGMDAEIAALFPDSFEESELGLIPKGWRVHELSYLTSYLSRGISPKYIVDGGVTVINQKCIRNNSIDLSRSRKHDSIMKKISGKELRNGDILVNSTGTGTLGRVAQLISSDETLIVDSHITVVRANEFVTWNYLGLCLIGRQKEIEDLGEGSTGQTELNRLRLGKLKVLVPGCDILNRFDSMILPMRTRIDMNLSQSRVLSGIRDALLPRLVSGQLRIPDAEGDE